jgi:hypothetical protein
MCFAAEQFGLSPLRGWRHGAVLFLSAGFNSLDGFFPSFLATLQTFRLDWRSRVERELQPNIRPLQPHGQQP